MDDYIAISTLNDFIFCPYSIYLHNVYMNTDEGLYHATPQTKGRLAHESIDNKTSLNKDIILALPVISNHLRLIGKIDVYKQKEKKLVERKYSLKHIYRGHMYQLWAQYFCMIEMGYEINNISFYEISTNKTIPVNLPTNKDRKELITFIKNFRKYNPSEPISININKCSHCIYSNLCDKNEQENVYE